MRFSVLLTAAALAVLFSAVPMAAENEIGYCENLESGDDRLALDWLGAASAVVGVVNAELGALFGVLASFGRTTDWEEYMDDVGQCIDAMISEAIENTNLKQAKQRLLNIAVYLEDIVDWFGDLSPDNLDEVEYIDKAISQIEGETNDIGALFVGPDGYKHEKFADVFLDALAMEGSTRMASIVAMQCQGVPQSEIESYANFYINQIQNRIDQWFQEGNSNSIMGQLKNSGFYTWPDTITKEVNEYCSAKPPPGGGVCTGNYDCTVVDGYRYDLTEKTSSPCDDNQFPNCEPGPVEVSNCDTLKKEFDDYARDTYANIERKVGEVAALQGTLQDLIEDAVANVPSPSVCECVLNPTSCTRAH